MFAGYCTENCQADGPVKRLICELVPVLLVGVAVQSKKKKRSDENNGS